MKKVEQQIRQILSDVPATRDDNRELFLQVLQPYMSYDAYREAQQAIRQAPAFKL